MIITDKITDEDGNQVQLSKIAQINNEGIIEGVGGKAVKAAKAADADKLDGHDSSYFAAADLSNVDTLPVEIKNQLKGDVGATFEVVNNTLIITT
jgi:hypothetical protein